MTWNDMDTLSIFSSQFLKKDVNLYSDGQMATCGYTRWSKSPVSPALGLTLVNFEQMEIETWDLLSVPRSRETPFGSIQNFDRTILKRARTKGVMRVMLDFWITLYNTFCVEQVTMKSWFWKMNQVFQYCKMKSWIIWYKQRKFHVCWGLLQQSIGLIFIILVAINRQQAGVTFW